MKIRLLQPAERMMAARVLASGMVDDPIQRAVHGSDLAARLRGMELMFGAILRATERPALSAWEEGKMLGIAAYAPPGGCPPTEERRAVLSRAVANLPPASRETFHAWRSAWGAHDPTEPHWHLGPFAVHVDAQGRGIGSRLLKPFLELVSRREGIAYLETVTGRNVRFYERFGFEVVGQAKVLGVECTFMAYG